MRPLKRLVILIMLGVCVAAAAQQLRRPKDERTWHGTVLGIPYDFRPPTPQRLREAWWNPDDQRLFLPRAFGLGWSLNLYRLKRMIIGPGGSDGDG